ncbi:hypothetical protein ES705_15613 [subsurface metagenome]
MIQLELTHKKQELAKEVEQLLNVDFMKRSPAAHNRINEIFCEIEGLNIKITGQDPVVKKQNKVHRPVRRTTTKKISNHQLILTF